MKNLCEPSLLELIPLNDRIASFSRLYANSIRYHHWHQCLELLYVEEGYGVVMVDKQQYTMRPGRLFVFPPMSLHKVMVEERVRDSYRRTVMHLDPYAMQQLLAPFPVRHARFASLSERAGRTRVYDLADKRAQLEPLFVHYEPLLGRAACEHEDVACFVLHLLSLLPEKADAPAQNHNGLSTQVMYWIEENYGRKFELAALASELNRSRSYLSRRFQHETGEQIHDYLMSFRLRKACELLRQQTCSVAEIAARVGFSDTTYFISCFRKKLGETPLQYRKNQPR
ncbi:AraC family transcriptional regulator [Franconibacter helveticus]|uniref:AraC family transcriptional regulator n=1 Tax=Franconibacter helveticus TaxID=357240 RepID=UPI000A73977F|nr:AraC family transcriptional regulator [Franconibacter helveticus]